MTDTNDTTSIADHAWQANDWTDFDKAVAVVRAELEYPHDGRLSAFGMLARALDLAAAGHEREVVANALHDSLTAFGWLSEDDEPMAVNTADGRRG